MVDLLESSFDTVTSQRQSNSPKKWDWNETNGWVQMVARVDLYIYIHIYLRQIGFIEKTPSLDQLDCTRVTSSHQ